MTNNNTTYREKGRAMFLAAVMVISVVAMSAAFAGSAAAQVTDATRTIEDSTLAPGESTSVTVDVQLDSQGEPDIIEEFDSAFADVTLEEWNPTFDLQDVSNTDVLMFWSGTDTASVTYNVTVPENATDGDTFSISGNATDSSDNTSLEITGDSTITVQETQSDFQITNVDPAGANSSIDEGESQDYAVTVENTGSASDNQTVTADVAGAGSDSTDLELAANESTIVTLSPSDVSALSSGSYDVTISTNDDSVAGTLSVTDPAARNLVDGEISDIPQNAIDNADEVRFTITYLGTGSERSTQLTVVDDVRVSNFSEGSSNPDIDSSVGDAGFVDNGEGNIDRYFINLPNFGDNTTYEITANLDGFEAFDGTTQTLAPGDSDTQNIRLGRLAQADELTVEPDDTTVDVEATVDATVTVESFDAQEPFDELSPFADEQVTPNVTTVDDPNDVFTTGDVEVTPTEGTTGDNGTTDFNVSLDLTGVDLENLDSNIDATVEFEAASSDASDTLDVTFQAEPPSGHGFVYGEVDEFDADLPIGTQNADAGSGISVHAVQLPRAAENTVGGAFDIGVGGSVQDVFGPNAQEEFGTLTVAANDEEYVRVVQWNDTAGEVVDVLDVETDYLFKGNNISAAQNLSIAGTGFDAEDTDGSAGWYSVTVLESDSDLPDDHTFAVEYSDDGNFTSPNTQVPFDAPNDLTYDAIDDRYNNVPANHTDVTDVHGNFNLANLYTDGEAGLGYVVIAGDDNADLGFANANGYDIVDPVTQSADPDDEQMNVALGVQELDVTIIADTVDITQYGTHPPLSETGGAANVSQIDAFDDQSDATFQRVSRDGTVDVIRVDTTASEFDDTGAESDVTIELADAFDGQFLDTVLDSNLEADNSLLNSNDEAATTIDITTDENGTAYVLLETEENANSLDTQKIASIDNGDLFQDEDTSNVTFVGTTNFESAGVSGIARDSDDTLVPQAVVWAEQFEWGADKRVTIEPDTTADPGTDAYAEYFNDPDAEFIVTLEEDDSGTWVEIGNDTATRTDLESYEFSAFPSISSATGFQLVDLVQDPETASYTLEPIPAVTGLDGETEYTLRGVKLDDPQKGTESLTGNFAVDPGEGETQNVIFPFDIEPANLAVSGVSDQTIDQGQNVTVDATIENTGGNQSADGTVTLTVDGEELATADVDLESGETTTVTLEGDTSDLSAGDYDMTVSTGDDSQTATLTVEGNESDIPSWAEPYVDDNGVATLTGASDAITDYNNGDLGLIRASNIIESYNSQTPIQDIVSE